MLRIHSASKLSLFKFYILFPTAVSIGTLALLRPFLWSQTMPPDSQFYTGYAFHGEKIFNNLGTMMPNAPYDNYFWTRLGFIVPSRVMFLVFGDNLGYVLLRCLLLVLICVVIAFAFRESNLRTVLFLQIMFSTNSLVLSSISGDYPSSFGVSITLASILAIHSIHRNKIHLLKFSSLLAGALIGFSFWCYPSHIIITGTVLAFLIIWPAAWLSFWNRVFIITFSFFGFIGVSLSLIAIGRRIFPGANFIQATIESIFEVPRIISTLAVDQDWIRENPLTISMTIWWFFLGIVLAFLLSWITGKATKKSFPPYLLLASICLFIYFYAAAFMNLNNNFRGWVWVANLYLLSLIILGETIASSLIKLKFVEVISVFAIATSILISFRFITFPQSSALIAFLSALSISFLAIRHNRSSNSESQPSNAITTNWAIIVVSVLVIILPNFIQNSENSSMYKYYNYPMSHDFSLVFQESQDLSKIDDLAKEVNLQLIDKLPKREYFAVSNPKRSAISDYTAEMLLWPSNSFNFQDVNDILRLKQNKVFHFLVIDATASEYNLFKGAIETVGVESFECETMHAEDTSMSYCLAEISK